MPERKLGSVNSLVPVVIGLGFPFVAKSRAKLLYTDRCDLSRQHSVGWFDDIQPSTTRTQCTRIRG